MSLEQVVSLSNRYGANPEYVLAGGGNTSYKDDQYLFVKGSGVSLASINAEGFVKLDRARLAAIMSKQYTGDIEAAVLSDMMTAKTAGQESKRPSVEALLHALFPQTYVLHLHPAMVNGITCSIEGKKTVTQLFGDRVVWIDEIRPGYTLAVGAKNAMDAHKAATGKDCDLLILQNHGIFFAADKVDALDLLVDEVMGKISSQCKKQPDLSETEYDQKRAVALAPAIRMLTRTADTAFVTFTANKAVLELLKSQQTFENLATFTPDHIVYCKSKIVYLKACDDIEAQYDQLVSLIDNYKKETGDLPKIIGVQGLGYFSCGKTKKEADTAAIVFMDAVKIAVYAQNFGGCRYMSKDMVHFITNWEVESYRKKVSLSGGGKKRLEGKISIVTGGAQGFGQGIAEEMIAEGAAVVIADLNLEGAQATAAQLCERFGSGSAFAVACNVADEVAVEQLIAQTVLCYGGLDIFVSNAGILKSGGLEAMDFKTFELMTKVNYSAYFLCVKYASRIMKIQRRFCPEYTADIIQINSKSGLSGSNKNFAYAGGKFGGIGLTQSFAMELAPEGIKVNAICPGNFYDGPLWSDPVNGLFVQYLNAGKVEGAKTIEDVRRFYEAKAPIRRGCTVRDVAVALFYIVEQQYETGQAVPVTGGQNMLN